MLHLTSLRRALGLAVAGALAATGLTLAMPVTTAHAASANCQASLSPSVVRMGDPIGFSITGDPTSFVTKAVADGALLPVTVSSFTPPYSVTYLKGTIEYYLGGATPSTFGFRFYGPGVSPSSITIDTPYACAASVDMLPALKTQKIVFSQVPNTPLATGSVTLDGKSEDSATEESTGLPVTYTSNTPTICTTGSDNKVTLQAQGQCEVVARAAGGDVDDVTYGDAADATLSFWVQLPQTITAAPVADQLLSTRSVTVTATAAANNYVGFYIDPSSDVCSVQEYGRRPAGAVGATGTVSAAASVVSSTVVELKKLGTCTISLRQPGYQGWAAAPEVTLSFRVVDSLPTATTGGITLQVPAGVALSKHTAPFTVTSSWHGAERSPVITAPAITTTSSTPAVCTVASASSVNLLKAGTCTLTAAQSGVGMVTKSFPVWGAPVIPAKGKTTQTIPVLGQGESDLTITAKPAGVCRTTGDSVTLIAPGTCKITVTDPSNKAAKTKVRAGNVKIAFVKSAKPSQQLKHGGKVLFAFDSAALTPATKKALKGYLSTLRKANTVIVYGNTYGPGKNSAHSRQLADDRAAAVVSYLKAHGVKAKAVTVAAAMQNPVSKDPAKNRRADIYYIK